MDLLEIDRALQSADRAGDPRWIGLDPLAARTALAMLTPMSGLPLAAIRLGPPLLSRRFPKHAVPAEARGVFGADLSRYRSWRRLVLDAQMLATGGPVEDDPWDALRRATRLVLGGTVSVRLHGLEARLPAGLAPAALTRAVALSVDRPLYGNDRAAFRAGLSVCDAMRSRPLGRAAGLGDEPIGRMPKMTDHALVAPLPPRLRALHDAAERPTRNAVAALWRMTASAAIFAEGADPAPRDFAAPEVWARIAALDPADCGMRLSKATREAYLDRFALSLAASGAPDPRHADAGGAWRALKGAVRAAAGDADFLSVIAPRAKAAGLRPRDVTPGWVAGLIDAETDRVRGNALRSACLRLDALRADARIPADLLPADPTGVVPRPRRVARPKEPRPLPSPVEQAWVDLFAAARRHGFTNAMLNPLSAIRVRALAESMPPSAVDRDWLEGLRAGAKRERSAKIAMGARLLDDFRIRPDLLALSPATAIGALSDGRRSAPPVAECVAADLAGLLAAQGAAASTRRAAAIAVKALADAAAERGRSAGSLAALLALDAEALDRGRHAARADAHREVLARLRAFRDLPWTPDWRRLQALAVESGVSMRDNPIPALLRQAAGRDPRAIDAEWADAAMRAHRRAGRADLALTLRANLARLDALRALPAIAVSGLLSSEPVVGTTG